MAKIFPFFGIRYNQEKIKDLSKVVVPPYDVISKEEKEKYHEINEYNYIKLILEKEYPNEPANSKYIRSSQYFQSWLNQKILIKEEKPCIYIYDQIYTLNNKVKRLRGFISLVRLEDYDKEVIFPHETTFYKPLEDRLNLMKTCQANFCSIYGIYADSHDLINEILKNYTLKNQPIIDNLITQDGISHYLWKIDSIEIIKQIKEEMENKQIIIGDGHHRYKTSLLYRNEMKQNLENFDQKSLYNHTLMFLANMHDEGISILPTYRMIHNLENLDFQELEKNIKKYFEIEEFPFNEINEQQQQQQMFERLKICGKTNHAFGMFTQFQKKYYLLILKNNAQYEKMSDINMSKDWKRLDAAVLHVLFIDHILHMSRKDVKKLMDINISYLKDEKEAIRLVNNKTYQIALFMNPPKIKEVEIIVQNKEKMPQKSTYFYPKLISGLVANQIQGKVIEI